MVFLTLWIYSFLRQHSCKWVFTSFRLILKLPSCLFDIYRCFRNRLDNFFQQDFVWKLFSKKTTTWIWQVNVKSSGRLFQIVMVFSECPNFNETIQLSILSINSITNQSILNILRWEDWTTIWSSHCLMVQCLFW